MKKQLLAAFILIFICFMSYGQTQTQPLNMGLHQLQFPSASGGSNRIQSYGGSHPGTWLFKSRFDNLVLDAGENESNTYQILFKTGNIERARIKSNGYFGIGTSNPDSKLTVKGNNPTFKLSTTDSNDNYHLRITAKYNYTNKFTFKYGQSTFLQEKVIEDVGGTPNSKLFLASYYGIGLSTNANNPNNKNNIGLYITGAGDPNGSGNVGIGITTPSEKLQIENGVVKVRSNNNSNRFIWSRTDNTMTAGIAGDGGRKMFFLADNSTRMTIDGVNGNVGIGTTIVRI